ncbi:serine protease [Vibrio pelagius]|uniref:Serine protease n=1 Tax=Vibrio pelagius TaxID=28169 RepID=A0ABY5G434_VIBPE|nr:serine protease [Vibrio pelagius]UTT84924.1 serine protease [Vibrio pelagius]
MKQTKLLSAVIGLACLSSTSAFADVSSRIINGEQAATDSWPFMTALVFKDIDAYNGQFCGASYIGKRYVLTASHCVDAMSGKDFDVVIGTSNLASSEAESHRYSVKNIYMHADYNRIRLNNDIAILELTEEPQEKQVSLVDRFTRGNLQNGQTLTVMGWGDQDASDRYASNSNLFQVNVPLVDQAICQAAGDNNSNYGFIGDDAFCAGFPAGGKDSCQGDSGGPIILETNGSYEQLGIVSWGDGCAQANAYGVYTNISHFESWIADKTKGFSYRENEYLGMRTPGELTHTFEFANYSDQVITVSNVTPLKGAVIVNNRCNNIAVGETCQIQVTKEINLIGKDPFGVQINTDLAGSEVVTSNVNVIGARELNQNAASLINIPNSEILSTEAWRVEGSEIVSPSLSHAQIARISIQGIPRGTVSLDLNVSTEQNYDYMLIFVNGQLEYSKSGTGSDTAQVRLVRETGNSIMIAYAKDENGIGGQDKIKFSNLKYTNEVVISKSSGTQVAKSGGSGGSFSWHWLLMLVGVGLLRKRH